MKWQSSPAELIRLFDEVAASLPGVEKRKMFGYPVAYVNGVWFTGLHQEPLVVRLSPADQADFLQIEGAKPFEPMPGRAMKEFVVVPPALLDSKSDLLAWLQKGLAYAAGLPPKAKKTSGARGKL